MRRLFLGLSIAILLVLISLSTGRAFIERDGRHIQRSMKHEGRERSFQLYVPADLDEHQDSPALVLILHAGGGSAKSAIRSTEGHFNKIAIREGLIVVYPEAVKSYWNEGRKMPLSYSHRNKIDDVGFLQSVIESVVEEYQADREKVFVVGLSNGGLMAYRAACELRGQITGIASIASSIPKDILPLCDGLTGTSLIVVNGTDDPILPYHGGFIRKDGKRQGEVLSTEETIAYWLETNQCPGHAEKNLLPDLNTKDGTTVTRYHYSGCIRGAQVALYRVEGGGHTLPGGRQSERNVGKTSDDINACDEIWSFFQQLGA